MSVEQMRATLKKLYGISWRNTVDNMPDYQVIAVYKRFLEQGKLKGIN